MKTHKHNKIIQELLTEKERRRKDHAETDRQDESRPSRLQRATELNQLSQDGI